MAVGYWVYLAVWLFIMIAFICGLLYLTCYRCQRSREYIPLQSA
jgi:hypothetical protein